MSSSGLNFLGRPNTDQSELKDGVTQYQQTIRLFRFCGGLGGGACVTPIGSTHVIWAYKVPKFITYNRKMIFYNPEFTGVRIYTDAGPDIFCSHSLGTEASLWMGLSASPSDDPETTAKNGVQIGGALPYEIVFESEKCPQPTDPDWEYIVYAYLWWGDSSYVNEGSSFGTMDNPTIKLTKHDYDINI